MPENQTLVVAVARESVESLVAVLDQAEAAHHSSARRNLDGDVATWIVVATLAQQALPQVLNFLQSIAAGHRVKKVKWGDLEIENPSREDLERFRAMIDKAAEEDDSPPDAS